ncbi:MAG: hypothetical protein IJ678_02010, partial [Kiritimatiellae bacterium]|nr:hypothetical protein [Kiritimatiellia bacterium]
MEKIVSARKTPSPDFPPCPDAAWTSEGRNGPRLNHRDAPFAIAEKGKRADIFVQVVEKPQVAPEIKIFGAPTCSGTPPPAAQDVASANARFFALRVSKKSPIFWFDRSGAFAYLVSVSAFFPDQLKTTMKNASIFRIFALCGRRAAAVRTVTAFAAGF